MEAPTTYTGTPGIGVDVDRSRCFPLANDLAVSGIRLNLAGREPSGTLAPGDEELRFVAQLEADLLAILDDVSGMPLVKRVIRTREIYKGEHLYSLPDLLVEWNDVVARGSTALGSGAGARVRATSNKIGVVKGANDYARSGEHRPGGWVVAAGPGVEHGRLSWEPSLLDLAPTIAGMLGVELPDADGDPITAIGNAGK